MNIFQIWWKELFGKDEGVCYNLHRMRLLKEVAYEKTGMALSAGSYSDAGRL
ncbi:hypothetical protein SAMN02745158_01565 [Lactonifactor longoviformis DSM 17459]|uniref:Uncharacterized protein n=1 Tax=Lactonifactor longoviformis DSM 17459 TaxID=1122155 RepID=A0A1M4WDR0_9CLOT|nr:hypothetical protein SAMN02745158_01565 [Lactonifactor longoviformis DSM 17459]